MVYPRQGANGVEYAPQATPDVDDTFWEHFQVVADVAALAGGLIGGAAVLTGVGAPIGMGLMAVSAGHFLGREISYFHDRDVHGQSNALSAETFPHYVNVAANLATLGGVVLGGAIPDPAVLGLDVVFPAAMAGLAVGLVTGRREAVAAGAGALIALVLSLVAGTSVGIVIGGLLGPLVGMAIPLGAGEHEEDLAAVAHGPGETGGPIHAEPPMPFGRFDVEPGLEVQEPDAERGSDGEPES